MGNTRINFTIYVNKVYVVGEKSAFSDLSYNIFRTIIFITCSDQWKGLFRTKVGRINPVEFKQNTLKQINACRLIFAHHVEGPYEVRSFVHCSVRSFFN